MVVEHAYIAVEPTRQDEFEEAYAAAVPTLLGAQGCEAAALFRDAETPGGYLLRVSWQRLSDHLEAFPSSGAGKEFGRAIAHFFVIEPEVRHFESEPVAR